MLSRPRLPSTRPAPPHPSSVSFFSGEGSVDRFLPTVFRAATIKSSNSFCLLFFRPDFLSDFSWIDIVAPLCDLNLNTLLSFIREYGVTGWCSRRFS